MITVRAFLPAFGVGFAFSLAGPVEKLAFVPPAGSSVTKLFTIGGEYAMDEISLIVGGQDVAGSIPQIEFSLKLETRVEVTDVYKAVGEGRPLELLRTFEALSSSVNMQMSPAEAEIPEIESTSELEGKTVLFRWNEEEQEYERSYAEGEGDEELLEGLEEDMDLRVFLPASEVAEGETWTVELADLQSVIIPGGNPRMMPEGMEVDQETLKMFEELFGNFELGDLLEGECSCTYKGARDEDGVRLAEIAIEVEVSTTLDLAEVLNKAIRVALEQQGVEDAVDFSLDKADLNLDFEGSGVLLWNLGAGRLHGFQLGGDATIDMDLAVSVEAEGQSQGVDASMVLSGSMHEEVTVKE